MFFEPRKHNEYDVREINPREAISRKNAYNK
jgi:hypothetical protein